MDYVGFKIGGWDIQMVGEQLIPHPESTINEEVRFYVPQYVNPSVFARAVKYHVGFNNFGLNSEWSSENFLQEDFRTPLNFTTTGNGLANELVFNPPGAGYNQFNVLKEGARGVAWTKYYTINQCNDTAQESPNWTVSNYRVNTRPAYQSFARTLISNPDAGVRHVDPTDGEIIDCTVDPADNVISNTVNNPTRFTVEVEDINGADQISTVAVWFTREGYTVLPEIRDLDTNLGGAGTKFSSTFGFMVEKGRSTGTWDWVFVPKYTSSTDSYTWGRDNSTRISNTLNPSNNVDIYGPSGNALATVRNVIVTDRGNTTTLTFDLEMRDHSDEDENTNRAFYTDVYKIYAASGDQFQFRGDDILESRYVPDWSDTGETVFIDVDSPDITLGATTVTSSNTLNFTWSASDESWTNGIYTEKESRLRNLVFDSRYDGSELAVAQLINSSSSDPNFTGVAPPAGYNHSPDDTNLNEATTHLGFYDRKSSPAANLSGTVDIDLNLLDEGSLHFYGAAFDQACNYTHCDSSVNGDYPDSSCTSINLGEPWIVTKGGNIYSEEGYSLIFQTIAPTSAFPILLTDQDEPAESQYSGSLWDNVFRFRRDSTPSDFRVTSGFALSSGGSNTLLSNYPNVSYDFLTSGTYVSDAGLDPEGLFDDMISKVGRALDRPDSDTYHINEYTGGSGDVILTGDISSNRCNNPSEKCIIRPTDYEQAWDMRVETGTVCDKPAAVFVPGDLYIEPNLYTGSGYKDGCVFIVQGDVIIENGDNQVDPPICATDPTTDGCYPSYDLIEAYIIANGKIDMLEDARIDASDIVNDALYVRGGLIAANSNSGGDDPAIQMRRTLRLLDNIQYPSLIIHGDVRYYYIAKEMFAHGKDTYKQDIGFK